MIDLYEVRKLSLSGKNKEIKKALISKKGLEAFKFIRDKKEATARQVSEHLNISIQYASTVLNKLHLQMYLRRNYHSHESGGIEWNYFL